MKCSPSLWAIIMTFVSYFCKSIALWFSGICAAKVRESNYHMQKHEFWSIKSQIGSRLRHDEKQKIIVCECYLCGLICQTKASSETEKSSGVLQTIKHLVRRFEINNTEKQQNSFELFWVELSRKIQLRIHGWTLEDYSFKRVERASMLFMVWVQRESNSLQHSQGARLLYFGQCTKLNWTAT